MNSQTKELNEKVAKLDSHVDNPTRKGQVHVTMQVLHFMVSRTFIEKMMNKNNSFQRIWCFIFARVTNNYSFVNMFALEVSITPMPSCSILFLVFFCGRNVACHGQKDLGPTRFAKSCTCNSSVY